MIKLIPITKYVGVLLSGDANEANFIIDKFKKSLTGKEHYVTKVAEELAKICRNEARKVNEVPAIYFPDFHFIIAGLDKRREKYIPRCYSLSSGSGFRLGLYQEGFGIDGKFIIARYLFSKKYKKTMSLDDLAILVAGTLYDTMSIDGDVGGKIKMAIINASEYRDAPEGDINQWIDKWNTPSP